MIKKEFSEKYTTQEKIDYEQKKIIENQIKNPDGKETPENKEKEKTILSNDAFALGEAIEELSDRLKGMNIK